MSMVITLSRSKFAAFLACQRRFQLRYLRQLPWPDAPLAEEVALLLARGQQFHQLLERHFLGLAVEANEIEDAVLRRWWLAFQSSKALFSSHHQAALSYMPELTLTIPVGKHLLNGRFDLLITDGQQIDIFDWKTGKPQPEQQLRDEWQTRLYLAMVAESGAALAANVAPEQIAISYWYVSEPDAPRRIAYNAAWHEQNWAEIQQLVEQIEAQLALDEWPLTDDLAECRLCAYQAYCRRQEAGTAESAPDEDADNAEEATSWQLEPNIP